MSKRGIASLVLLLSFALLAIKVFLGFRLRSAAFLSLTLDGVIDVLSSGATWYAIRVASEPPDSDHPFGHAKAESLGALVPAALLFVGGGGLLVRSLSSQNFHIGAEELYLGLGGVGLLAALTMLIIFVQKRGARHHGSQGLAADSEHYSSDVVLFAAAAFSLVLQRLGAGAWTEQAMGIILALFFIWRGALVLRSAGSELMDVALPDEELAQIDQIIRGHDQVLDYHDLRTRRSGGTRFIQVHLDLPAALSLKSAHDIADAIERELRASFPGAEPIIHQDPV